MFFDRGRRIPKRRVALFVGDAVCVALSLTLSAILRLGADPGWAYILEHVPTALGSLVIFMLVFYAGGMYEPSAVRQARFSQFLPVLTTAIGAILIVLVFYARLKFHVGRGILLLASLFIVCTTWLLRRLYRIAVGYGFFVRNALVIGDGDVAREALRLIDRSTDPGLRVAGVVTPGPFDQPLMEGVPVLGSLDRLKALADVYGIDTLILAGDQGQDAAWFPHLRPLRYAGVELLDFVALHEELAQEIPLDHINDEWLMNAAMNSSVVHIRKIKRILDFTVAGIGLVLSAPIALLAALLVKVDSPGPVFFRQRREGLDGRVFNVLKFRTMRHNAEAHSGAVWSRANDTRITRIGRFLRKWRIDEIPQLINVLRGEMSLVGPRPERPEFVETLAAAIPYYRERVLVPPGITGWAQIRYPYAASIDAARRKLQFDLYYIKHMSFFLDTLILLKTFKTIVVGLRFEDGGQAGESDSNILLRWLRGPRQGSEVPSRD